jgi:hypothetical protein
VGTVCKCGKLFHKFVGGETGIYPCECGLEYRISNKMVTEVPAAVVEKNELLEILPEVQLAFA